MKLQDIKVGMKVDYHSIIGGPATDIGCEVMSDPWELGHGDIVVKIDRIRGGVSLDALTESKDV